MITKERLEELIKENATIYNVDYKSNTVEPINLLFTTIDGNTRHVKGEEDGTIFETKKQAEWASKYHTTRTEELNLPMWEEFKDYHESISVSFVGEDWCIYELSKQTLNNKLYLKLVEDGEVWKRWDFNEENYIKACDLCLKLFEGEEDGN